MTELSGISPTIPLVPPMMNITTIVQTVLDLSARANLLIINILANIVFNDATYQLNT